MSWESREVNWEQFSRELKANWEQLSDDDLQAIRDKLNRLTQLINNRPEYARERALIARDESSSSL